MSGGTCFPGGSELSSAKHWALQHRSYFNVTSPTLELCGLLNLYASSRKRQEKKRKCIGGFWVIQRDVLGIIPVLPAEDSSSPTQRAHTHTHTHTNNSSPRPITLIPNINLDPVDTEKNLNTPLDRLQNTTDSPRLPNHLGY